MRKISTVFDFIIYDFFVFIVLFIIFSYITNGIFPLLLTAVGLVFFSALFFKIRGSVFKKRKHAEDTLKRQKLVETSLLYQTNSECLDFFTHFFSSVQGLDLKAENDFLIGGETIVYPCFSSPELGFEKLLAISKIARQKGCKNLILPCIKCSCQTNFLDGMFETISIFESRSLFEKMIEFDFFPTMIDEKVLPKKSFKTIFQCFVLRKNARGFGLIGLSLFAFALISPYKIYYFVASTVLLSLSCFLILKGTSEKSQRKS